MRLAFSALALIFAVTISGEARAQMGDPYPWCAEYTGAGLGGSKNCYFMTFQQCLATVSGVGGFCSPNPFHTGPTSQRAPRPRRPPQPRYY